MSLGPLYITSTTHSIIIYVTKGVSPPYSKHAAHFIITHWKLLDISCSVGINSKRTYMVIEEMRWSSNQG